LLLASGCRSAPAVHGVPAYVVRERMRAVEVGQTIEQVHAILRRDPVRRPRHPDDPFPTPLRVEELVAPDGSAVRLEIYVVATRPADGCPDHHYDDAPVLFVDGRVAGLDWEFVEWGWRGWGGRLEVLRGLQDRYRCPDSTDPVQE
jgi:hypothetical protein